MHFVGLDCQMMVQALICAQDWLRSSNRFDMDDYFDELRDFDKPNVQFFIFPNFVYLLFMITYLCVPTFNFFIFISFILDLGKLSLKDNVIDVGDTLNILH